MTRLRVVPLVLLLTTIAIAAASCALGHSYATSLDVLTLTGKYDLPFARARSTVAGKIQIDSERGLALVVVDESLDSDAKLNDNISGKICRLNISSANTSLANVSDCVELRTPDGEQAVSGYNIRLDTSTQTAYIVTGTRTAFRGICRIDRYGDTSMSTPVCKSFEGGGLGTGGASFGIALKNSAAAVVAIIRTDVANQRAVCAISLPSMNVTACAVSYSQFQWRPFTLDVDAATGMAYVSSVGYYSPPVCKYSTSSTAVALVSCANGYDYCAYGTDIALDASKTNAFLVCETPTTSSSALFRIRLSDLSITALLENARIAGHALVVHPGQIAPASTSRSSIFVGTQGDLFRQTVQHINSNEASYMTPKFCLNVSETGGSSDDYGNTITGMALDTKTNSLYVTQAGHVLRISITAASSAPEGSVAALDKSVCSSCNTTYSTRYRLYWTNCNLDNNLTVPYLRLRTLDNGSSSTSVGIIVAGIVLAAVGLIITMSVVAWCVYKNRQLAAANALAPNMLPQQHVTPGAQRIPVKIAVRDIASGPSYCPVCMEDDAEEVAVLQHVDDGTQEDDDQLEQEDTNDEQEMTDLRFSRENRPMTPAEADTDGSAGAAAASSSSSSSDVFTVHVADRKKKPQRASTNFGDISQHKMCKLCRAKHEQTTRADMCPWCRRKVVVLGQTV